MSRLIGYVLNKDVILTTRHHLEALLEMRGRGELEIQVGYISPHLYVACIRRIPIAIT